MNLRKKLMTGALVSVMAVALSTGWGSSTASASDGTLLGTEGCASTLTVDYVNQTLTVKTTASNKKQEVMVCVPKVKTSGSDTTVTETTWDVYSYARSTVIDLSTLSTKAESYLLVKTYTSDNGETEPLLIQFNAVSQTVKAAYTFSDVSVAVTCTANKTKGAALVGSGNVEYRTASGDWTTYTSGTTDLSAYQQTGATLYFREAASESTEYGYDDEGNATYTLDEKGGYDMLSLTGYFASAEAKCKITKLANGPSATINYDTHQMTIKKNCDYRTDYTSSEWKSLTEAKALDLDNEVTTGLVEVRTTATEKKAASKITRYEYTIETTSLVCDTLSITQETEETNIAGVEDAYLAITGVSANAKKNNQLTVTLQNDTDKAYQICVLTSTQYSDCGDTLDDILKLGSGKNATVGKFTVTTIKAGKPGKVTVPNENYLVIREASDKKTGTYATTYKVLGQYIYATDDGENENE